MTQAIPPAPPMPPSPNAAAATDKPCLNCGYSLTGLSPGGNCPECGTPVARSLGGNRLVFSSPDYVAMLHKGVFLVQASIIGSLVVGILGFVAALIASWQGAAIGGLEKGMALLGMAAAVASALGWWLFSSPDPAFVGRDTGMTARQVVRVSALIGAVAGVGSNALQLAGVQAAAGAGLGVAAIVGIASFIAMVVWYFAAMMYLTHMAPRLPDERVYKRAKMMMWLGPVLYTFGLLLLGLGPLIALILYYNLLEWVRKDLKGIRADQGGS